MLHQPKRITYSWPDLPTELLEVILPKLSFIDMLSFKGVSSSWCNTAQNYLSLPFHIPRLLQKPLLMLPYEEEGDTDSVRFLSLEHKRVGRLKNMHKELYSSCCVGSSHGWLVLMDENADPFILNLFSQVRIQLPNKEALPDILSVRTVPDDRVLVIYKLGNFEQTKQITSMRDLCNSLIKKAILSSKPSQNKNYRAVIIYGLKLNLAFFRPGDNAWTDFEGQHGPYCDITCTDNKLIALSEWCSVEVWGFHSSFPIKTLTIKPSFPIEVEEPWSKDLYTKRFYLVETSGDLLLVERYIGEFVRDDGEPVYEADLLTDEDSHPLVCPYKTLQFRVYKLELGQKEWVEVESLSNCMLFLGGNHSMSLSAHDFPECKANSIYFTDDYWERMDEDILYGGHDMGIFNLDYRSVEPLETLYDSYLQKFEPPPFWVVPNP